MPINNYVFSKCHGLWDEDEVTDNTTHKDESDGEMSEASGRRDSVGSLKSVNLAASAESIHVHFPEDRTVVRRKSSSSGSHISRRSSYSSHNRSKRGKCFAAWTNPLKTQSNSSDVSACIPLYFSFKIGIYFNTL